MKKKIKKIRWFNIIGVFASIYIILNSMQDLLKILSIPAADFNNKILLLGQITIGFFFIGIYLLSKIKRIIDFEQVKK